MRNLWKCYFIPKGFMGRWDYFKISLIMTLVFFIAMVGAIVAISVMGNNANDPMQMARSYQQILENPTGSVGVALMGALFLLFLYTSFCVTIKRVNDIFEVNTNKLTVFLTIVMDILGIVYLPLNIALVLVLFFFPGLSSYEDEPSQVHLLQKIKNYFAK
ncbi:MAG: hypothetical protein JNM93_02880 [Bacteriovoracaceae bacterium]|nr:hypothetical protein [Bacteriovoracaceae bacterium]